MVAHLEAEAASETNDTGEDVGEDGAGEEEEAEEEEGGEEEEEDSEDVRTIWSLHWGSANCVMMVLGCRDYHGSS